MLTTQQIQAKYEMVGTGLVPDGWDANLNTLRTSASFWWNPETGMTVAMPAREDQQYFHFTLAMGKSLTAAEAAWQLEHGRARQVSQFLASK